MFENKNITIDVYYNAGHTMIKTHYANEYWKYKIRNKNNETIYYKDSNGYVCDVII